MRKTNSDKIHELEAKIDDLAANYLEKVLLKCLDCMGYSRHTSMALEQVRRCSSPDCALFDLRGQSIEWYHHG